MNGPNPVCTLATKKTNQSRPRRLWRDGCGGGSPAGRVSTGPWASLATRAASPSSGPAASHRCGATDRSLLLRFVLCLRLVLCLRFLCRVRRHLARRAEHHQRIDVLEFGRSLHLVARQLDRDDVALVLVVRELQHAPVDRDLAAADAEETAEIDDRGA